QTKQRMVHTLYLGLKACSSVNVQESITGEEHLAEVGPSVLGCIAFAALGITQSLGLEEASGRVQFIRNGRSVDNQFKGARDARVIVSVAGAGAIALAIKPRGDFLRASRDKLRVEQTE